MTSPRSIRQSVKSIPIIGSLARGVNRCLNQVRPAVLRQRLLRAKHFVSWHIFRNPRSRRLFGKHDSDLTESQRRCVDALRRTGIAVTTVEEAGVNPGEWEKLRKAVEGFSSDATQLLKSANEANVESLDYGRLQHNKDRFRRFFRDKEEAKNDDYIIKMMPENSVLASDHPLISVGLSPAILDVVNGYLGLLSKMVYTDAWHSIPMDPGKRIGSQRWHRDPEDRKMVKVYLYVSNIDANCGPMEYLPGTANVSNAPSKTIAKWLAAGASLYPPVEEIDQHFPASARIPCTGSKGTLVFCDTTGLHRGGVPRSDPRVIATWTFVTPAALNNHRFSVRPATSSLLTAEALYAVS